jgi:flagellum-specific peptidoglycan hydrolase FlgJ
MKNWYKDIGIILAVFIIGICAGFLLRNQEIKILAKKAIIVQDSLNISQLLEKHKIKFSHIVLAQAKLESNNFKSDLYKRNWNCFGMKVPAQRWTFAENTHDWGNYAKYKSLEDCIMDYKSWQLSNTTTISNDNAYLELLNNMYAENPNYVKRLKELIK